jgi:hypothetical protein
MPGQISLMMTGIGKVVATTATRTRPFACRAPIVKWT